MLLLSQSMYNMPFIIVLIMSTFRSLTSENINLMLIKNPQKMYILQKIKFIRLLLDCNSLLFIVIKTKITPSCNTLLLMIIPCIPDLR